MKFSGDLSIDLNWLVEYLTWDFWCVAIGKIHVNYSVYKKGFSFEKKKNYHLIYLSLNIIRFW